MENLDLPGKLIVIEGTDGVGRTTHVNLLHDWLESKGRGVLVTGLTRSPLIGQGLQAAKQNKTAWASDDGPLLCHRFRGPLGA